MMSLNVKSYTHYFRAQLHPTVPGGSERGVAERAPVCHGSAAPSAAPGHGPRTQCPSHTRQVHVCLHGQRE